MDGLPQIELFYASGLTENYFSLDKGEILKWWQINSCNDHEVKEFEDFWQNCLILIEENNHPRLVWVPHPTFDATNYKLHRGITENPKLPPSSYNLIYTSDASTFNFTDIEMNLNGTGDYAFYYVKAYNSNNDTYSSSSNEVNIYGEFAPYKYLERKEQNPENQIFNYKLNNYPNPFNPTTTITYSIPEKQEVKLRVYDPFGREVAELVNDVKAKGSYQVTFNGSNLASGVYYYTITAGNYTETKKLMLLK